MMQRPRTLAEAALRINAGEDKALAIPEFLDTFYLALRFDGAAAAAQCIAEPPAAVADPNLHACIGAIGEHLALRWNLAVPAWTDDPSRFLRRPHFTTDTEGLKAMCLAQSPTAFRRRMIFTEAEPLRRARMPLSPTLEAKRTRRRAAMALQLASDSTSPTDGATRPSSVSR